MVIMFRNNLLRPSSSCERNAVPVRITLHEDHKFLCKRKRSMLVAENWSNKYRAYGVDKNIQVDVTFCILYFSSNNCSKCFGNHVPIMNSWGLCEVIASCLYVPWQQGDWQDRLARNVSTDEFISQLSGETNPYMDALPANRTWQPSCSYGTYKHEAIVSRVRQLLMVGTCLPEIRWAIIRREIKNTKSDI
jgi:hypothetical protein